MNPVMSGCGADAGPPGLNARGSARATRGAFFGVLALVFAASAVATVVWSASMSEMEGMPMAGAWTMSMAWMPLPGQTWLAAASFLGMWVVMMVAMMLPSLAPILWRYRQAVGRRGSASVDGLTAWVGLGYFLAWAAFGLVAYPMGLALAALTMESPGLARVVPVTGGWAVLIAGMLQISRWKSRHLACCRPRSLQMGRQPAVTGAAWRYGLRLGLHCCHCCASLMVVLLVSGVMDLRAMAVVTAGITLERLLPDGERAARAIGVVIVGAGLIVIARTVNPA